MPQNAMFAPLKNERLPKFSFRRVAHSTLNVAQATGPGLAFSNARSTNKAAGAAHPNMQGVKAGVTALGWSDGQAAALGMGSVAGNTFGAGGMVAGAMTLAGYAGGAAGAVAAFGGPQIAITAGVLGLVALAAATYSNREEAHVTLTKHCWSLIDDVAPTPLAEGNIEKAGQAALTLLTDGQNQVALMKGKLDTAKIKLNVFNQQIESNNKKIRMFGGKSAVSSAAVSSLINDNVVLIERGMQQGGEIYQYARRVIHLGNYLQAPAILAVAIKNNLIPSLKNQANDYFAGSAIGRETREAFVNLETLYTVSTGDPEL